MNKLIVLLFVLTASGFAQPAAPEATNPLSTWLRDAYTRNRTNIVRMAEKMPEENYGMRPGTQPEVRTFGQQVTHVATYNYLWKKIPTRVTSTSLRPKPRSCRC